MALYPLKFKPLFQPKIWGGRKLQSILNKPIPPGPVGESWEIYDFPPGAVADNGQWLSAAIENGPLAGWTLHDLMTSQQTALLGNIRPAPHGQFPLLVKFLDARENLSIQVHPDAKYAARHPSAHLKSEAWYIIQADPDAMMYKGLKPATTPAQFSAAIAAGDVEAYVEQIPVRAGDCHYLPSGQVHALGAGILAAEVQTPSDTTFRVFDFNRLDSSTGRPRRLHVREAMECIDFSPSPPMPPRSHVAGPFTTVTRLVASPFFVLEKVRFSQGVEEPIPYDQPAIWIMLDGEAQIQTDIHDDPTTLNAGETILLPAHMSNPRLKTKTDCIWLEATFPSEVGRD